MRTIINALMALTLLIGPISHGQTKEQMAGFWVMPDGAAVVEIYQTDGEDWAIRISALRDPHFTAADKNAPIGEARTDINNPDSQKRTRALKGLKIGDGFKFTEGALTHGRIYDPGSGKAYRAELKMTPGGLLDVRGFVGLSFIGKTMYWYPYFEYQQRTNDMFYRVDAMSMHLKDEATGESE